MTCFFYHEHLVPTHPSMKYEHQEIERDLKKMRANGWRYDSQKYIEIYRNNYDSFNTRPGQPGKFH